MKLHNILRTTFGLAMGALLCACASSSDRYPSLAIRDVERASGTFYPVAPQPIEPAAISPDTVSRIEQLVAQARSAHSDFASAAPSARASVNAAAGLGPESNVWAVAQVALADLDSHRSLAAIALADLDLLFANATLEFSERARIDAAREEVIALLAEEDAVLADLRGTNGSWEQ